MTSEALLRRQAKRLARAFATRLLVAVSSLVDSVAAGIMYEPDRAPETEVA
jgi:hypothetical protein